MNAWDSRKGFLLTSLAFIVLASIAAACATPAPAPASLVPTSTSVPVTATREPARSPATPPRSAATETPRSVSTATPEVSAAGAQVPSSCSAIESLVGSYMGGVATSKSLGSPQHLSCEFQNAKASTIIIVNIGVGGTPANFDALRATSAQGGRTVQSISGLGVSAFSVSKNNVPAGVSVLTAQGILYVVESNLPIAQDQALIEQLMKLF